MGVRFATLAALGALLIGASAAQAGPCGLPDEKPMWVEFSDGSVTFREEIFGRPGLVLASAGVRIPQVLRERGAATIYWEMNLDVLVGTPSDPEDPSSIESAAETLFDRARISSGCDTPWIALNELQGSRLPGPWSASNTTYRENVLQLMTHLQHLGAHPVLLVPSAPAVEGEAGDWWADAAAVGTLAAEVYFAAPVIHGRGPVVGARMVRQAFRKRIRAFTDLGIPADRLALMLGFQSGRGAGGREGLEPTSAWLDYVKMQALAAREIALETGIGSIWSWGWGTFGPQSADDDKPAAACVYLWTRDPSLCDAPGRLPRGSFDPILHDGPIVLEPDSTCEAQDGRISTPDLDAMARFLGNRDRAYSHLLMRMAESAEAGVPEDEIDEAEAAIVKRRFRGDPAAYNAAVAGAGLTRRLARALIEDQLRRDRLVGLVPVGRLSFTQVAELYRAWGKRWVRRVRTDPPLPWLRDQATGLAIQGRAPAVLFRGKKNRTLTLRDEEGRYRVRILGKRQRLEDVPLARVYPYLADVLRERARERNLPRYRLSLQQRALTMTVCRGDLMPKVRAIDPSRGAKFLNLRTLRPAR